MNNNMYHGVMTPHSRQPCVLVPDRAESYQVRFQGARGLGSMSKSFTSEHELSVVRGPSPQPDEIRRHLQRLLASHAFHGSKRYQQFLEYVCAKSLAGEVGAFKERSLAVEVFGKQPHIDLGEDTIVRVGAREVRKRLAQYYSTAEELFLKSGSIYLPACTPRNSTTLRWRRQGKFRPQHPRQSRLRQRTGGDCQRGEPWDWQSHWRCWQ